MNPLQLRTVWTFFVLAAFHLPAADAGYRITYEFVSVSEEGETPEITLRQKNALLIDSGRMRTVNGDVEGYDLIADLAESRIFVLDAKHQTYAQIDFPPLDQLESDTHETPFQIEVEETAPPVLGYAVRLYRIYEDSALWREIVSTNEIDLGFDYMRAMEGLQRAFQEFDPEEDFAQLTMLFRRVHGVPLSDVQYFPFGKDILQAKKIDRVKFKADEFLPPKNYTKRPLRNLSDSDTPGSPKDDVFSGP